MSFKARLTLAAAAAVAVAVVLAAGLSFVLVRDQLRSQVDDALRARAARIVAGPAGRFFGGPGGGFGDLTYVQLVRADGTAIRPSDESVPIPVDKQTVAVAAGTSRAYFHDATVAGAHVRVLVAPVGPGLAVQVLRPLDEVDRTLRRLGLILGLVAASGIGIAVLLGLAVARTALAPVRRLTDATEHVAETHDLTRRIQADGRDELARLASSFNAMLAALEDSVRARRQLVADASHELRTPLTSLRTNIEVLAKGNGLPVDDRERLMRDVVEQLEEMTVLVGDVVELAREGTPELEIEDVRLDLLVGDAVERARRLAPDVSFATELEPSLVRGAPRRLERAVANLLDNAAKWSPDGGGGVEVRVRDGEVEVRDHGPGVDEADLPFVFDRFYRAPGARGMPGSGLGLAIVKQVAELHGGDVSAERAEGGGSRFTLRIPAEAEADAQAPAPADPR